MTLQKVKHVIPYRNFGGPHFNTRLNTALIDILDSHHSCIHPDLVILNVPTEPVSLRPDGKLKHIRFTPIISLTRIPPGEITELSFDEVKRLHPELEADNIKCPGCDNGLSFMFWYKYGLDLDIENSSIYMVCQYCGHDDYLN